MKKSNDEYKRAIAFFEYVKELNMMMQDRHELLRHVWLISPEFRDWSADVDDPKRNELIAFCEDFGKINNG